MNNLKIFENKQFGKIRIVNKENEIYFVANDICKILNLTNITETLKRVDLDDLSITEVEDTLGRKQVSTIVNESGLYSLILQSRKEQAINFKRWITKEVLPSIRKHGGYISGQENLSDDELLAKALTVAQNKITEKNKLLEEQKPKVLFANSVETSKKSILIGELAKIIKQNNIDIGQNRLFDDLRESGYLGRKGEYWNIPTQKSMELGLFEIKKSTITNPDGSIRVTTTTKVTGKGQVYFINKYLTKEAVYIGVDYGKI